MQNIYTFTDVPIGDLKSSASLQNAKFQHVGDYALVSASVVLKPSAPAAKLEWRANLSSQMASVKLDGAAAAV